MTATPRTAKMLVALIAMGFSVAVALAGAQARAQGTSPVPGLAWVLGGAAGLPPGAMVVGVDQGRPAYACRVNNDGVRVGKVVGEICLVPMSGAEVGFPDFEVLTGEPWLLRWPVGGDLRPGRGLVAGDISGQRGVLCVVESMGGVHPGMVLNDRCHFGLAGKEIMAADYRFAEPNPPGEVAMRHASGGWVPAGALTVAGDAASLPLCLGQSGGAWVPGMVMAGQGCVFAAAGQVERAMGYTVVVGDPRRVAWVPYENGALPRWEGPPENSMRIGGYQPAGPPLEICRADVGGTLAAGHVEQGRCQMAVANGGRVASAPTYQVLHYIHDVQQADQSGRPR